jgi:ribosomal protein S6
MKFYELTYLLSPKLEGEEVKSFSEKITSFIRGKGGILEKESLKDSVIKRKLASPIKKEAEAYLNTLSFYSLPQEIEELKARLDSENQILRYFILAKKSLPEAKAAKVLPRVPKIKKEAKPAPEKVDLKEIEQKLEEILGQ